MFGLLSYSLSFKDTSTHTFVATSLCLLQLLHALLFFPPSHAPWSSHSKDQQHRHYKCTLSTTTVSHKCSLSNLAPPTTISQQFTLTNIFSQLVPHCSPCNEMYSYGQQIQQDGRKKSIIVTCSLKVWSLFR